MKRAYINKTIILICAIVFPFIVVVFVREHGKHDCRFIVKLKDREPVRANLVNYYKAGVVDVIDCKGNHTVYPTTAVEMITEEP